MNMKYQRNTPPPPRIFGGRTSLGGGIPMKLSPVLLFFLIVCLAVPVQSQVPTRLTNPTAAELGTCGLPATWAQFNDTATLTTFNMTDDCTINSGSYQAGLSFLYITSGEFTINGNGHSIIGLPGNSGWVIYIEGASTVLNLNNVTLRGNGAFENLVVHSGARLNARNVTFRDNNSQVLRVRTGSQAYFEGMQFLNNTLGNGELIEINDGNNAHLSITNGIFRGNTNNYGPVIHVEFSTSFSGSNIIFDDNTAGTIIWVSGTGQAVGESRATLQNVQFLNNRQNHYADPTGAFWNTASQSMGSAISAYYGKITITNGIFRGNTNHGNRTDVIVALYNAASNVSTIDLEGCMAFAGNVQADGSTAASDYTLYRFTAAAAPPGQSRITDSRTGVCPPGFRSPKKKKEEAPAAMPTATPRPAYGASYIALQTETGMTFEATYGLDSGVHFRQLDGAGIGIQSIIDAGYLAALDVYGYVEQGVEVCFPQMGRVIFLDARTMPRAIVPLESTVVNGQTCVSINSPGSLVLLPN